MPIVFVSLLGTMITLILASYLPYDNSFDRQTAYKKQANEDFDAFQAAYMQWFDVQTNFQTRFSTNAGVGSSVILPNNTTDFNRMIDVYSPINLNRGDYLGKPYYVYYLGSNSLMNASSVTGQTNMLPVLSKNATTGKFSSLPMVFIAGVGPNGHWDMPTTPTTNVPNPTIINYLTGKATTGSASLGDDVVKIIRFDSVVNKKIMQTKVLLSDSVVGLGVYFNYKSLTIQGYYPLTARDFSAWSGVYGPANYPLFLLDAFGYPLYYSTLNAPFVDAPTNTQPLQVDIRCLWMDFYNL